MSDPEPVNTNPCGDAGELARQVASLKANLEAQLQNANALRQALHEKDQLLNCFSELFCYYDLDLRVRWANKTAAESVGLRVADLIGRHCYEVWHRRQTPCVDCPVVQARQTGQPHQRQMQTPDGRHWLVRGYPVLDENGALVGLAESGQDITAIVRDREALRKREERLALALSAVNDGVWDWNIPTNEVYFSPRYFTMLGYEPNELPVEFSTWQDLLHPDDRAHAEAVVQDHIERKAEKFIVEFRLRTKDGGWKWILGRGQVVERDPNGAPVRMIGTHVDISDRKLAEDALRRNEEQMRLIFERQNVGMAVTSPEKGWVKVNDKLCDMLGYSRAELQRLTWAEITYPEDLPPDLARFEQLLAGQIDRYSLEKRFVRKDGSLVYTNLSVGCVRQPDGSLDYVLALLEDITERKQAQENLKRIEWMLQPGRKGLDSPHPTSAYGDLVSVGTCHLIRDSVGEEMLRAIVQEYLDLLDTSAAVYESNGDYALGIFSSGWCQFMDQASRTLCHTGNNREALACGKWHCHESCWTHASKTCMETRQATDIECAGGIRLYAVPIWSGGKVIGAINFGYGDPPRDAGRLKELADRYGADPADLAKRAEAYESRPPFIIDLAKRRLHSAAQLIGEIVERKAAQAERERLQSQLLQAQKMESVGRLAGGVAHDFNNMLGVIIGHVELSLDRLDPSDPLYLDLAEILKAAQRSADLTRQLLAFARRQTVSPKILDLNQTVAGMFKMLQRIIGEDIELAWRPGADLWPVRVDPTQIDQILANLCVNARDAIADAGRITIETSNITIEQAYCDQHANAAPGEYVMLAISDNGCGMSKDTLEHIFEPFYTTKAVGQGTGLGLATVYGIVRQNSGFINVYSEVGQGSTFKIFLPHHAARTEDAQPEPPAQSTAPGQGTVLLVEDEPAILSMGKTMLERLGYQVLAAGTPGEAIHMAQQHPGNIDLLMTDVVMPEMNGRDLARRLLTLYPGIKRLFMSGYTANVIAHHGVLDEGVNFIQKPFSLKDLAAKVQAAIRGS